MRVSTLLGGLALFVYGMNGMSDGLREAAGEKLKQILKVVTKSTWSCVAAGALTTAVLQSSSATICMAVGFVSAGIMGLPQAICVIFGANMGTTVTAQLLAFRLGDYAWLVVFSGFVLLFFGEGQGLRHVGQTVFSFGLLFVGIETMGKVMEPLAASPVFTELMRRLWMVLAGILAGAALAGGIYYMKNVTFGGVIPYTMDSKYYLEYAVDPGDQQPYSYFASYTWNDLLKSEAMVEEMLGELSVPMTVEELKAGFEPELMSDLRICYIHTTHRDAEKVREIDRVVGLAMSALGERQKELLEVSLLDRGEPRLAAPDLRTFRACVLGTVLGGFFSLFGLGLQMMLDEKVYVPGTLARRWGLPVAGYVAREGKPSKELGIQLGYLLGDKKKVGVTAVGGESDPEGMAGLFGKLEGTGEGRTYTPVPGLSQAPEAGERLRGLEAVVLLVQAGRDRGKAVEEMLRQLTQLGVEVDAMVLTGADDRLIRHYLWGKRT